MKIYGFLSSLAFLAFYLFYIISEQLSLPAGTGYFYPMDDVYIHLEMAKNISENGVFSVNADSFDPASSSLLYSFLLSILMRVFGDSPYYPLAINFIFGMATSFYAAQFVFSKYGKRLALLFIFLLQPLCMVYLSSVIGMEHTIHMFLIVLFFIFFDKFTSGNEKCFYVLLILVFLLGAIRFESIFFVFALALVFLLQKKFSNAVLIGIVGFLPVICYGWYALAKGGLFLPNAVVVKSNLSFQGLNCQSFLRLLKHQFINIDYYKFLFPFTVIFLLYAYCTYRKESFQKFIKEEGWSVIIITASYFQMVFGIMKFRYENYLMLGLLFVFIKMLDYYLRNSKSGLYPVKLITFVFVFYSVAFGVFKMYWYHPVLYYDSKNLFYNQYRLAKFLEKYYNYDAVIANDIGAITYYTDIHILDMYGLGTTEVAKMKYSSIRQKNFADGMNNLSKKRKAKIAVLYPELFPDEIPESWILVGRWRMINFRDPRIRYVNFYAISKDDISYLRKNLKEFENLYLPR